MSILFDPNDIQVSSKHFIDGQWNDGNDDYISVIRPSDLQEQGVIANGTAHSVDLAVGAARNAFNHSGWATQPPRERASVLRRWADLIDKHADEIAKLESAVSCRVFYEVSKRDVRVVSNCLRFYAEYSDKVDGRVTSTPNDVLSLTLSEPWGVVAAIVPWNFPLILSAWKFAPALAAGNCVVMKPSELTPYSVARIAELAIEAGLPAGVFNIIQGTGASAGSALTKHPDVNYITFTGSTATGAQIMSDAAFHGLKPVSLELGGKGPQVVFADAPSLDIAARMVAIGVAYNAGQVCFAGSRLVVEESIADEFITKVSRIMSVFNAGTTWDENTKLPPIISSKQASRMDNIVKTSISQGAELVCGGEVFNGSNGAYHYKPTILNKVSTDMTVYKEEVFGPVLAVQTFKTFEEAIELSEHPMFGLAASVHTQNINKAISAARKIQAGTIWINDWGRRSDLTSPFGGYKQSGIGKDVGLSGYLKYRKTKAVWFQTQTL
ncbi:MAG: aldehyde dehydrogenase [Proteobacteria bacterium]|nr:aldehyde dehydrogenase [Pseudomonadota bacterium]